MKTPEFYVATVKLKYKSEPCGYAVTTWEFVNKLCVN